MWHHAIDSTHTIRANIFFWYSTGRISGLAVGIAVTVEKISGIRNPIIVKTVVKATNADELFVEASIPKDYRKTYGDHYQWKNKHDK